MHDLVAHSMSVMVVQAGGARRILDRDPGRALEAATRIERTGREALGEMRHLLGVPQRPDARPRSRRSRRWPSSASWSPAPARPGCPTVLDFRGERRAAARRARPRRVPDRPGGTHQRPQARRPRAHDRDRRLEPSTTLALEIRDDGRRAAAHRRRRARPGGYARARAALRRRARGRPRGRRRLARARDAAARRARAEPWHERPAADRRRPGARARRVPHDPRRRGRPRGRRRGHRRARRRRAGPAPEARRRADGHPHARAGRDRGHAAPARRRPASTRCAC